MTGLPSSPSAAQALRDATAAHHAAIETQINIAGALADPVRCRGLLASLLGFYEPLEAQIAHALDWESHGIDIAERRKTPALTADLRARGLDDHAISQIPRCREIPRVTDPAAAFGCAYVLEGATLGARVITRLAAESGFNAPTFFAGYGENTARNWRRFLQALEAFASTGGDLAPAKTAAVATFETLGAWLSRSRR